MRQKNRIRTMMYGDQRIMPGELELLHTPSFQRLYDLHQLGMTDRIYIDASHSRLHHVVGVLEQVEMLIKAVVNNLRNSKLRLFVINNYEYTSKELADIVEKNIPIARYIGLLHDLTHSPYGHTLEDEIELTPCKHDDPERQADAFYRLLCQYIAWLIKDSGCESRLKLTEKEKNVYDELLNYLRRPDTEPPLDWELISSIMDKMINSIDGQAAHIAWRLDRSGIAEMFGKLHVAMTALLHLELLHKPNPEAKNFPKEEKYPFQLLLELIVQKLGFRDLIIDNYFEPRRDAYLLDIVGNTVCADLLDYAHRDSHHTNIKLEYDAGRIAENFTLVAWDAYDYQGDERKDCRQETKGKKDPFQGKCLRTAISLFSHKLRIDVFGELMNLLNVRFYLYERVMYHSTKCAADAMLGTALQLIGWRTMRDGEDENTELLPKTLRYIGDTVFLNDIVNSAIFVLNILKKSKYESINKNMIDLIPNKESQNEPVNKEINELIKDYDQLPQINLAKLIFNRWLGCKTSEVCNQLEAGIKLLERINSRRYLRPVFRVLPSMRQNDRGVVDLSETFIKADVRYNTERTIEKELNLPPGSIVLHCPYQKPSQKIANVLLYLPEKNGKTEKIRKLRHIGELETVFVQHQKAILAVEEMYFSMWKLIIYTMPHLISDYAKIGDVAGRVIAKAISHPGEPLEPWPNDPYLEQELANRIQPEIEIIKEEIKIKNPAQAMLLDINKEIRNNLLQKCLYEDNWEGVKIILEKLLTENRKSAVHTDASLEKEFISTINKITMEGKMDNQTRADLKDWYKLNVSKLTFDNQMRYQEFVNLTIRLKPKEIDLILPKKIGAHSYTRLERENKSKDLINFLEWALDSYNV